MFLETCLNSVYGPCGDLKNQASLSRCMGYYPNLCQDPSNRSRKRFQLLHSHYLFIIY